MIKDYLSLARIQTAALTSLTPVLGFIANGGKLPQNWTIFLRCLFIGLFVHIYGFVSNELMDFNVDRLSPELKNKPLVKKSIPLFKAKILAWVSFALAWIVAFTFYPRFLPLFILFLSNICGDFYNRLGKKFPGSDIFLALWAFLFCLFGALLAAETPSILAYLIASLAFLQILFNNSIEGGLKDIMHDSIAGVKSLMIEVFKVKVEHNFLIIPHNLKIFAFSIKMVSVSISFFCLWVIHPNFSKLALFQTILICLLALIIFKTLFQFCRTQEFNRSELKRVFARHEIATFFLVPVILLPLSGTAGSLILALFPLLWFIAFNRLLYGTLIEPGV